MRGHLAWRPRELGRYSSCTYVNGSLNIDRAHVERLVKSTTYKERERKRQRSEKALTRDQVDEHGNQGWEVTLRISAFCAHKRRLFSFSLRE